MLPSTTMLLSLLLKITRDWLTIGGKKVGLRVCTSEYYRIR